MLSYLGEQKEDITFVGEREYGERKFINAVESYIAQDYPNKEMIIVSDGCRATNRLYHSCYGDRNDIKLVMMPKSPPPPPPNRYRHAGIVVSTGDRICYLDPDDCLFPFHLTNLEKYFPEELDCVATPYRLMVSSDESSDDANKITYLKDIDLSLASPLMYMKLELGAGYIGGGNIAHKRNIEAVWGGNLKTPGRNGDLRWIMDLKNKHPKYRIYTDPVAGYLLCQGRSQGVTFSHDNNIVEVIRSQPEGLMQRFNLGKK